METYPSAEITDYPFGLSSVQNPMGKKKSIRFSDLAFEELKPFCKVFKVGQENECFMKSAC